MSNFNVKVCDAEGKHHEYPAMGFTAGEVYDWAAAKHGYLCSVFVKPE